MAQQHVRNILAYLDAPTLFQPEVFIYAKEDLFNLNGNLNEGSKYFLQTWMNIYVACINKHASPVVILLEINMKILMILTSHDKLADTGKKTGFWLEEFAAPYYQFIDAGANVTLASPLGGQPPLDPSSDIETAQTDATRRFKKDTAAQARLASTLKLGDVAASYFDALFYPGGHGPLWDLAENGYSIALIQVMLATGKPVAAVCHAPGVLRHVKSSDGQLALRGKAVTGFSNTEEDAVGLTKTVPFLVEDMLKKSGALYSKTSDWQPFVITDGLLITGQNPASSKSVAIALLDKLQQLHSLDKPVRQAAMGMHAVSH